MNQANQQVVIQNANMNLVQIRTFELDYFTTFFSNFGTQSALMIGFIAGSISQVPGFDNPADAPYFWVCEYWITCALTMGTATACLLGAFFLIVFGQGLAIRGPEGSMIKTIEGMIAEQHYIVILFSLTIFFFGLNCMGMYYIMFDSTSALVTVVITGLAMLYGYREALRLYNRFSFGEVSTFFDERDQEDELNELDPSLVTDIMSRERRSKKRTMQEIAQNRRPSRKLNPQDLEDPGTSASENETVYSAGNHHEIKVVHNSLYGAYLTVRDRGKMGREKWKRRYFLVRGTRLFYYRDRRNFELSPAKPINKRPIDLDGYSLSAGSTHAPYPISLVPYGDDDIRKVWKFRCDTESEYHQWIHLFQSALREANPRKPMEELIMISDEKFEAVSVRPPGGEAGVGMGMETRTIEEDDEVSEEDADD